ncbi:MULTISPECIES: TetR/AcrR family transcriptional regulator [unclassified Pseudodesulfovibrio]|uniref:TetR/AcrR family transcriptional regulator n=1 Tax=unclassified Pseudodesulfovibrio TaxID=2661612 RepID=UPI000FEB8381|nr:MULTISPECIES: TetR/AcrR family transcriptional regulator [unclassified Pseudodesulfovibrio]MCJ2164826.1 TetR/AcrR family transcriptional regulator [Pseudodesulfovibrio sp. S3-i]RWU03804.1 TetR/AcrR family transcriptional regulator [Pseudodesulfovibrio sp. S3]
MTKKEAILRAAQEAFGQLGFTSATVKDVAGRADVSFGLVSHYFGSKHDLFLAAGFDMADRLVAQLTAATSEATSGIEAIRCYMTAYFDFTEEHRNRFPILLRCSPFSHMEPGVDAAKVATKFIVFIDELKRCVALGIEDGTIRPLPLKETALIIYGNIVGSVRTSLLTPYKTGNIFAETINHVERSLTNSLPQVG